MTQNERSSRVAVGGIWAMVGGQAGHWLLTPLSHPQATELRTALVVVQAILGFGAALWFAVRPRRA